MIATNRLEVELLFDLQHGNCYYCKSRMLWHPRQDPRAATLDHKIPTSRGGSDDVDNKCACCLKCNNEKSDLTEAEYWKLKDSPVITIRYEPYKRIRRTMLFRKQNGKCMKCSREMIKTQRVIDNTAIIMLYDKRKPDIFSNSYLACYKC